MTASASRCSSLTLPRTGGSHSAFAVARADRLPGRDARARRAADRRARARHARPPSRRGPRRRRRHAVRRLRRRPEGADHASAARSRCCISPGCPSRCWPPCSPSSPPPAASRRARPSRSSPARAPPPTSRCITGGIVVFGDALAGGVLLAVQIARLRARRRRRARHAHGPRRVALPQAASAAASRGPAPPRRPIRCDRRAAVAAPARHAGGRCARARVESRPWPPRASSARWSRRSRTSSTRVVDADRRPHPRGDPGLPPAADGDARERGARQRLARAGRAARAARPDAGRARARRRRRPRAGRAGPDRRRRPARLPDLDHRRVVALRRARARAGRRRRHRAGVQRDAVALGRRGDGRRRRRAPRGRARAGARGAAAPRRVRASRCSPARSTRTSCGASSATFGLDPEREYIAFRARGAAASRARHDVASRSTTTSPASPLGGPDAAAGRDGRASPRPAGWSASRRVRPCQPRAADRARVRADGAFSLADLSIRPAILADEALGDAFAERHLAPLSRPRDGARGHLADLSRPGHADRGHGPRAARAREHAAPPAAPFRGGHGREPAAIRATSSNSGGHSSAGACET